MFLLLISFLAGVITVATPCILPLLPVIIGGSVATKSNKRSFTIIISLILTIVFFTLILKFFTIFINIPENFWNYFSGILILLLSFSILFPKIWYKIPLIGKISVFSNKELGKGFIKNNFIGDIIIGASLGPIFSTCSPTYFLILATVLPTNFFLGLIYLFSYSIGLGLSLLLISLLGQKALEKFEMFSNPKSKLKLIIGILFLITGILIITGWQNKIGQYFINKLGDNNPVNIEANLIRNSNISNEYTRLQDNVYGKYSEIVNPSGFLNTEDGKPINIGEFIGKKIILIDFMTYSCINCQRTFPYLNDWYEKYHDKGLEIIAIHTPEFAFEKNINNVKKALDGFGIKFPVVLDNDYGTWNAYNNQYWPMKYIIDLNGNIVYEHPGEGNYQETEDKIVELLKTIKDNNVDGGTATTTFNPDFAKITSSETYLGYDRLSNSATTIPSSCFDTECKFSVPDIKDFDRDTFSFDGNWTINDKSAYAYTGSSLYYHFNADKVHIVASGEDNAKIKVSLDGGEKNYKIYSIKDPNLYTILDLNGNYGDHILKIEIINGKLIMYTFTFS